MNKKPFLVICAGDLTGCVKSAPASPRAEVSKNHMTKVTIDGELSICRALCLRCMFHAKKRRSVIIPISHLRKLRLGDELIQRHTANEAMELGIGP